MVIMVIEASSQYKKLLFEKQLIQNHLARRLNDIVCIRKRLDEVLDENDKLKLVISNKNEEIREEMEI